MEVFVDKEFAEKYWEISIKDSIKENFEKEFLRHSNYFTVITNYSDFEEIKKSEEATYFFEILLEYQVADIVFQPYLLDRECITDCLANGDFKILFINSNQIEKKELEERYGYKIIQSSDLEEDWNRFITNGSIRKSLSLPVDFLDEDSFNGWKDLSFIGNTPLNSVVIVDKYILADKSAGRITDNLIPLLEQLIPEDYIGELSIVILSEEILTNQNASLKEKAKKVHNLLNSRFSKYKSISFKFSIVKYNKAIYSHDIIPIHERFIYTNYYTIHCGKGYGLFNGKNRINSDADITVSFNFQRFQMKTIPSKINSIKKYLKKMETVETLDIFKHYPENITCPVLK